MCEGGEPGRAAVWRRQDPIALQKALHRIRPVEGVSAEFVAFLLRHAAESGALAGLFTGTTIKHLPQEKLRLVPVPLPPTAEQERIVTAIEEAFSKLDAGESGLRSVRQLLKRMREAVLAAAVTGRLVPQDPTEASAAELLASLEAETHTSVKPVGLPDGWCWSTLGEVSLASGYGSSVKCGYDEAGVGVLRIPNVQRGLIDLVDLKRAPDGAVSDDLMLAPGDLLIVRTNGSRDLIGRSAPVMHDTGCSFASYLIRFRLNAAVVEGKYVSLMLASSGWRRRLEASAASSAGQYNLSLRTLEPMPVAVPPLEEQHRIVSEVERQFSFIDAGDRAVDVGLARSVALRRSVLQSAFEGRLIPQHSSDEPASVLLERIRIERAVSEGLNRTRRRTKVEAS